MAAVLPTDHERRAAIVTVHGEDLSPAGVAVLGRSLDQQEIAWLCSHRYASSNIGVIQRQSPEAFSSPPSEAQLQGKSSFISDPDLWHSRSAGTWSLIADGCAVDGGLGAALHAKLG
jgi:hypothetical protein